MRFIQNTFRTRQTTWPMHNAQTGQPSSPGNDVRANLTPWPPEGGTFAELKEMPGIRGITPSQGYLDRRERAVQMRNHPTPAEAMLWARISDKQLGVRFRRQQLIQFYIVDFYCVKAGLVIEIDGCIHNEQEEYDAERERIILQMGYSIVRFTNEEVLNNVESVIQSIKKSLRY